MPDPVPNAAPAPVETTPAPTNVPTPLSDNSAPPVTTPNPAPTNAPVPVPGSETTPAVTHPPAANWGDDWREKLVGDATTEDGKKRLTQLQRLSDPKAMYEKMLNQEKLISSGQLKKALPEGATDTELKIYREENDVPETHDKYLEGLALDDGMVIGEDDKPVVDAVLKELHAANMPKGMAKVMLNTYFKQQNEQIAARDQKDAEYRDQTTAELRQAWGGDFTPNLNLVKGFIGQAPAEAQEGILNARMPDGRPLLSNPGALRWLANAARQINPVATLVPGAADPSAAISTELASLKGMMGDKNSEYWKGPNSEKNQQRYRELLGAADRYK